MSCSIVVIVMGIRVRHRVVLQILLVLALFGLPFPLAFVTLRHVLVLKAIWPTALLRLLAGVVHAALEG